MLSAMVDGLSIYYICIVFDSHRSRSIDTCWGLLGSVGVGWGLLCSRWQQVVWEFFMFARGRGARNFNDPLCERSEHLEKFWGFSRGKMLTPRGSGVRVSIQISRTLTPSSFQIHISNGLAYMIRPTHVIVYRLMLGIALLRWTSLTAD